MLEKDTAWDWVPILAELRGLLDDPDEVMDIKVDSNTKDLVLITEECQMARLAVDGKIVNVDEARFKPNRLVVDIKGNIFPPDVFYSIGNDCIDIDREGNYWKTSFGGGLWVKNHGYPEPDSDNHRIRDIAFNPQKDAFFLAGDYTQYFLMRNGQFKDKVTMAGHEYSYTAYHGERGQISVSDSAVTSDNVIYVVGFHEKPRLWQVKVTGEELVPKVILEEGVRGISDLIAIGEGCLYLARRKDWPKIESIDRYVLPSDL